MVTTVGLIVLVILIALVLWLVPMQATLQKILIAIAVILGVIWLLGLFGLDLHSIHLFR